MRKFFSVLLCIILVISICICSSVSGSALFVADDLIYAIGLSMAASVLLSIGIAAVSDSDSQYVEFAEACAQLTWEQMVQDYSQAEILAMITIQNGKAYFRCPETLFTKLKNWALNYDFSSLSVMNHISTNTLETVTNASFLYLSDIPGKYSIGNVNQTVSYSAPTYTTSYVPSQGFYLVLNDGTMFKKTNLTIPNNLVSLCCMCVNNNNTFALRSAYRYSGNSYYPDEPNRCNVVTETISTLSTWGSCVYNGVQGSLTNEFNRTEWLYHVKFNGTLIAKCPDITEYSKKCIASGCILTNVSNNYGDINSDSDLTSTTVPVDTEVYNPAIPGNRVGSDQTVLVPIPSTFEDPSNPGIPLPQRTVKNKIKRGQEVALVPDLPSLKDKTPQDLGVLVVNNTDIQDTTISPTLNTTVYGDDSTTFVIIPQFPINTPIPNDDNQPLVSSPYPDVINPGNETITVTANDDIFPTANNPPATTARPSVSVSNPDEVASSAAEDVVEGVSEIASQAVKDIAEPLTPSDIEKGANRMKLMPQLLHKFPFCIPFDFYNAINQFSAPSEVPQFDIPIRVQSLNFDYNVHVDLTNFETAAKISRWFFSVAWVITLIFLTRKVIWK